VYVAPLNFRRSGPVFTKVDLDTAVLGHPSIIHINFLKAVVTTWLTHEFMRWEQH